MRRFWYIRAVALVLIHGLGTGPEAWQSQVEALAAEREVVTPRLRLEAGFSVDGEAERLWRELPEGTHDLCGLSLGAIVALQMAVLEPERARSLTVCAGFASLPRRYRALQAVLGTALAFAPPRARGELAALDGPALRDVFRAGRRFDVSAGLERLAVPTLVLVGERDRANLGLSRALAAALPDGRFEVVPGAGHVANADAPEEFTAKLRSFLADRSPQPS
jgi:pimeloyl-ACP methyl ester carboxylesterase